MQAICIEHPTEETLERYLFNHAFGQEFDEVETHLFVCGECIDRVEEIREFRAALRDGFELLRRELEYPAEPKDPSVLRRFLRGPGVLKWPLLGGLPRWAFVPALGALLLGVLLLPNLHQPGGAPFDASLSALRGDEPGPVVPAGQSVQFHLNLEGVASAPVLAQVVDGEGRPVGPVQVVVTGEHPTVQLPPFAGGDYFLRIYPANSGRADQQLLREFSFQAK